MSPTPLLVVTDGGYAHASSRTRAALHLGAFRAAGFAPVWVPRVGDAASGRAGRVRFAVEKRLRTARQRRALAAFGPGVVLVQRQVLPEKMLAGLHARGARLVYDVDDALHLRDPDGVGRMLAAADAVVAASPELAPFVEAHGKTPVVLPTPVDTARITPAAAFPDVFTVGWIGSPWTTPYLAALAAPLAALARRFEAGGRPFRVRLVGADPAAFALPGVPVEVVPWRLDAEADALRGMSVGVMPLPDDAWAAGKGAFKLYQYMTAGLPVVASPVGLNRTVVEDGVNGFLAADGAAWETALLRLADDPALARRLGAEGRRRAETSYSAAAFGPALAAVLRGVV